MRFTREQDATRVAVQWTGTNIKDLIPVMRPKCEWILIGYDNGTLTAKYSKGQFVLEIGQWLINDGDNVFVANTKKGRGL